MSQFTTSSTRWAALQSRDSKAASAFVYCVTTTKIYCRPTCPSRLARRANIVFHETAAEAAAEGFRACKRCRPELRNGDGDPQKIAVKKACDLVRKEQSGGENRKWSVKALATEVGLTESHFCRIFKKVMGMTVGEYRTSFTSRIEEGLQEGVTTDQLHIFDAAQEAEGRFTAPNIPRNYGYDNGMSLADFDCSELERNWLQFTGNIPGDTV
jgi:methylphosphotriester-DNA--protein-cysteine methyltransferase